MVSKWNTAVSRRTVQLLALGLFAGLPAARAALAQESERRLDIHGFGGWVYGRTNTNEFVSANPDGSYGPINFALNVTAFVTPKLTVIAQPEWRQGGELEVELDYAFAEWAHSDELRFRIGRVKHPFGIYTEVFDVGTVRPFFDLPQSVYGALAMVAEGYTGVGIRGTQPLGKWSLAYDAYLGGLDAPYDGAPVDFLQGDEPDDAEEEENGFRDVVGGRVVVHLPLQGLSLGASGYTGRDGENDDFTRHSVFGAQAEYLSNQWWVRTEVVRKVRAGSSSANSFYGEVAYFVTPQWQIAGRHGFHLTKGVDGSLAPSLLDHREWEAGVNYWVAPEFVIKTSLHLIRGNRLAGPPGDELAATVAAGGLERNTRLFQAGAQFSF